MPEFKTRSRILANGGMQVGSNGNHVNQILTGSVAASVAQITASGGWVSGSLSIPYAPVGAMVFVTPINASAGLFCYRASVCTVGNVSACFVDVLAAGIGACDVNFRYVVIS